MPKFKSGQLILTLCMMFKDLGRADLNSFYNIALKNVGYRKSCVNIMALKRNVRKSM